MPISYIYTGEPMTGTLDDDFIIAYLGSTGTSNNTINGNDGDDLVIGDSSDTWIPNQSYLNNSIANAFNLESLTSTWTTGENQLFGDWTIPHTTAMCETTIGQSEFFRVAIGAGEQIVIDLDFASSVMLGNPRDIVVELQDSLGNVIATSDDSLVTDGGQGSFPSTPGSASSYDPYLVYTVSSGGVYYINVRPFGGGPGSTFTENHTFVMNVSVTGHAVNASNPVQGNDLINGGNGDDYLFGQGGADFIIGGVGNDFIDGGSGVDTIDGGIGDDTIYGGDGTEETVHGDEGNDVLHSGGEGHYFGDGGNDIIYAGLTSSVNEMLDGGVGIDTIDTTSWNGAYVVNLATGATNFGESFINFENVVSGNGADTITGTAAANTISTGGGIDSVDAGGGDDIVSGGALGDTLDGGAGFDVLDYRASSGAVVISLATNNASGGHAAGDIISNFEGVWGSVLSDTLTGTTGVNRFVGGGGNDVVDGRAGVDASTYSVASTGATWTRNVNGSWTVNAGGDGVDILTGVEFLGFTDRDVFLDRAARTFSGNGTSDILFRRADGIMSSWEVTGTTINTVSFLPTAGAEWSVLGAGDVSGDGRDDVVWQRSDGLVYAWLMNGGFSSAVGFTGVDAGWSFLGMGDFNGDLTDDFAWQRSDGLVFIWNVNGAAIASAAAVTGLPAAWVMAGLGDFNSDGRDDFLWRNSSTGQTVVWHMNGTSIQSSGATSQQATLAWSVVGVGDTNGDGRDDVILQRTSDGMIAIWAMNGTSVMSTTDVGAANPADWTVRGVGDYNGDGRDDILWQQDNGLVYVWLMNGASIQSAGPLAGIGPEWGII